MKSGRRAGLESAKTHSPEHPGAVLSRLPRSPRVRVVNVRAVRQQVVHAIRARLVVTFPPARVVTVRVTDRYRGGVDLLAPAHPNGLKSERGLLLLLLRVSRLLVVKVHKVVVDAVARTEMNTGAGVYIHVARHTPTRSPLQRTAGRRAVSPGLLGGRRRRERRRVVGPGFPVTRFHGARERVVGVPTGQR